MSEFIKLEQKKNIIESLKKLGQAKRDNKKIIFIAPALNCSSLNSIYEKQGIQTDDYRLCDLSGRLEDAYQIDLLAGSEYQIIERIDKLFQTYRQQHILNLKDTIIKDVYYELLTYSIKVLKKVKGNFTLGQLYMFILNGNDYCRNAIGSLPPHMKQGDDITEKYFRDDYLSYKTKTKEYTLDFRSFIVKLNQNLPKKVIKPFDLKDKAVFGEVFTYPIQSEHKALYMAIIENQIAEYLSSTAPYSFDGLDIYYLDNYNYEFKQLKSIIDYINQNEDYFKSVFKEEHVRLIDFGDVDDDKTVAPDVKFDLKN